MWSRFAIWIPLVFVSCVVVRHPLCCRGCHDSFAVKVTLAIRFLSCRTGVCDVGAFSWRGVSRYLIVKVFLGHACTPDLPIHFVPHTTVDPKSSGSSVVSSAPVGSPRPTSVTVPQVAPRDPGTVWASSVVGCGCRVEIRREPLFSFVPSDPFTA